MNKSFNYKDILLKHKMSVVKSRSECDISTSIAGKIVKSPVFCANMPSVLTFDIAKQFDDAGWFHIWHRMLWNNYNNEAESTLRYVEAANENNFNFVSISVGVKKDEIENLKFLKATGLRIDSICIDVALIYNKHFEEYIKWVRENFPNTFLIAGNCTSFEAVKWLDSLGVDCVKINIGVSSVCRTRQYTAFGSATVTDLINIQNQGYIYREPYQIPFGCVDRYEIPKPLRIKICADGGLTQENGEVWIGDCSKSIRFGADYIMSGALFKNCIDSPALIGGYSGNSTARIKGHSNHIEGTTVNVQSNGLTIKQMIKLIEDSLKSAVSYAGGTNLEALKTVNYQII